MAVLRQLPPAVAGKDIKPGEYVVERRGAWKLRLLDSSSGSAGLSLAQQQMERLLLRAKAQLKQSQRMRAGQTKIYGPNLRGGTGFTAQLRAQVAASTRQTESHYADHQEWRRKGNDRYLSDKARRTSMALGLEGQVSLTRRGSSRPNSGASMSGKSARLDSNANTAEKHETPQRKSSLRRSSSVDRIGTSRRRSSISLPIPEKDDGQKETNDSKKTSSRSAASLAEPSANGSSCALCHSSSIGYNLCCQFRDVIKMLEQERLMDATESGRNTYTSQSYTESVSMPGTRRTARSRAGRSARPENIVSPSSPQQDGLTSRDATFQGGGESMADRGSTPFTSPSVVIDPQPLNERVLQLFAKEDAAMVGIIKYKEKEVYRALYGENQARVGLAHVAAHFRDRFKHVGLFMQMHRQHQQAQQDGIGGHYQKLHADLYSANSKNRKPGNSADGDEYDYDSEYDSDDDYDDSDSSARNQLEPAQSRQTVQSPSAQTVDSKQQSVDSVTADYPERLFPTPEELELLTPIDTKAALALYVQNRTAMAEMLDGYAELATTQMVPTLQNSLSTRNRGALVETLDFVARASEFVCARRVQVFVAKLLHAVAESDIGDFTSFQKEFDELLVEMQGAVNFIRFFLQTKASRRKNKNK
ncbi:unnamed protein product [Phytophthora lilii]|uniref:Unnamed protein product n=1 Tax=Phytophthora lilii TaxID=2077276 RepID=A0A9W6TED0_9STRA|nr:unnamed protein product [Phytophthora lilii]